MKTAKELQEHVGKAAMLQCEGMAVPVMVMEVRQNYGRVDFRVTPQGGEGDKWVQADKLTFSEGGE